MPLISGIHLALQAILSHQQAIQVIEHNVANANTPGYHRQEAVLGAGQPYPSPRMWGGTIPGQMGTGVVVNRIRRFTLDYFDGRYRREIAASKRWELKRDMLQQVELTLAETSEDGLIHKLDAFWNSWQMVSSDPSNIPIRAELRETANALVAGLNGRFLSLKALRDDQDLAVQARVDEINHIATQVGRLNVEISHILGAGDQPNDLMDSRDELLDRLAELTGAVAHNQENGEVLVSVNGHALVVGSEAFELITTSDPLAISFVQDGIALVPKSGELAGLFEARDVISDQMDGLNDLAKELVDNVNALHQAGYGLNGTQGDFFKPFTTTDYALEIELDPNINDLNNIAAAQGLDGPGDGNNAIEIAKLQSLPVLIDGDTQTLNQYYTTKIGQLGLELRGATSRARARSIVSDSLAMQRESVVGVSLDEEAVNLVKAQKAFQAAARLMTTLDSMLDRIINGMGLVGR